MFDFISYVREMGLKVTLSPGGDGELIRIRLLDPKSKYMAEHTITDREASTCTNIDQYTRLVLDRLMAQIGVQKAKEYSGKQVSRELMEREKFFRGEG